MSLDFGSLISKTNKYKEVLQNTIDYRKEWEPNIKPMLQSTLKEFIKQTGIKGEVKNQQKITNLEAIILDLGKSRSGIIENMDDTDIKRVMIKNNGALVYQQLFNGKIMVMIVSPYIEGYGDPKPPKTLEILRPNELNEPFILRHLEVFLKDITEWEDFDDDEPQKKSSIGFQPVGFSNPNEYEENI
jgi:hypothetical protein